MSYAAIEDLNLPLSVVNRLIKEALPPGHEVSEEARLAIARAATIFVFQCSTHAAAQVEDEKRTTLTDVDVFHGLKEMKLDALIPDVQKATEEYKKQRKAKKVAKATSGGEVAVMEVETIPSTEKGEEDQS